MKILILLLYYDRPEMVQGALNSVLKAGENYSDWELAFIDDSSPRPGWPVMNREMCNHIEKVKFYHTATTPEAKHRDGGYVGKFMNQAIVESGAEIAIMLCDDDQLHPDYLIGLDAYFRQHPDVDACYSHVFVFNPLYEKVEFVHDTSTTLNSHLGPINPEQRVDASQVAWRTRMNWEKQIWFAYPRTKCLDADFYWKIGKAYPEGIPFSGLVGQYKGVHPAQLSYQNEHDVWAGKSIDITNGRQMCPVEEIHRLVNEYIRRHELREAKRICDIGLEVYPSDQTLTAMDEFLYFEMR